MHACMHPLSFRPSLSSSSLFGRLVSVRHRSIQSALLEAKRRLRGPINVNTCRSPSLFLCVSACVSVCVPAYVSAVGLVHASSCVSADMCTCVSVCWFWVVSVFYPTSRMSECLLLLHRCIYVYLRELLCVAHAGGVMYMHSHAFASINALHQSPAILQHKHTAGETIAASF